MAIKDAVEKVRNWWTSREDQAGVYASVDDQGLIRDEQLSAPGAADGQKQAETPKAEMVVKKVTAPEKKESIEKLNDAFNRLVEQLQGINDNLARQVNQHENLMTHIDKLPEILESLPGAVENQKQVVDALTEQLKAKALKDQQFAEEVAKIPTETAKQTDALAEMSRKLSVSADVNVQMSEGFNRFNDTLEKLDADTVSQTDGIMQMSKTFATSDRYLKYIISKQHRRFVWVFITAISVCVFVILALVISIVMVLNR